MKLGLNSSIFFATLLVQLFRRSNSSCEVVDTQIVRDEPDECFNFCTFNPNDGTEHCEWKCNPAPKRYIEVRSCCPGYQNVTGRCLDIDECQLANGDWPCEGRCINLPGTFRCECLDGFQIDDDGITCKDVDECRHNATLCTNAGKCINTRGSFHCECNAPGHRPSTDGKQCVDVNECDFVNCNHKCVNTPGSYYCMCDEGFELDADGKTCYDIDECDTTKHPDDRSPCQFECVNTPGSYKCECPEGYRLGPHGVCFEIDECSESTADCDPEHGFCHNVQGRFYCTCETGFVLKSEDNKTCVDIDECQDGTGQCAPKLCENTSGSYRCTDCLPGYRLLDHTCIDIDECQENLDQCESVCVNSPGNYSCSCLPGYELTSNQRSCQDINECIAVMSCSHICENLNGSFACSCPEHMSLSAEDNATCIYTHYASFFYTATNRLLAGLFIIVVAVLVLSIVSRIVYNACKKRQRLALLGMARRKNNNQQLEKLMDPRKMLISRPYYSKFLAPSKSDDSDRSSYGYHLAVPSIDEELIL